MKERNRRAEWAAKMIRAGRCRYCGRPRGARGTETQCRRCARKHAQAQKRIRERGGPA